MRYRGISRRRVIGLLGVTMAAPLVAACGASQPPAPAKAPADAKPATEAKPAAPPAQTQTAPAKPAAQGVTNVRVALNGQPEKANGMKGVTERFEASNPNVKIEYVPVQAAEWDEYYGKLVTMLAGGQPLDLTEISSEGLHLSASKQIIKPIDDLVVKDKGELQEYFSDIAPSLPEAAMYKGNLYYLPWLHGTAILYYSTKIFQEAGVQRPADDWTVDDFLAISKKIVAAKPGTYAFGWPNRHWGGSIPWLFINDTNLYAESKAPGGEQIWKTFYANEKVAEGRGGGFEWGEPRANHPNTVEALQFLADLTHVHKVAPTPAGFDDLANFFASGKLAMLPAHRFMVGRLKNAGVGPEDFDVMLMPKWKTQRHQFGCSGLSIMQASKNPEAGWPLAKWVVRKDEIDKWVAGGVHTSVRRSVANDPKQHESIGPKHWQVFYDALDKRPDTGPIPAPVETKEMTTIFVKYVGLAMANEMPVKEATDKMQSELAALAARTKR
jgi:multiple sugar transport system substrate-binding protein